MIAHEFSTCIGSDGRPIIPVPVKNMPVGSPVRVIVLTDEKYLPAQTQGDSLSALENVIREIKNSHQNPENIYPASGLLAEHLKISDREADPCFSPAEWNREWDRIEAEMKAEELAEQRTEGELP
ncbi:MAG TPA: hypothetical protein ENK58_01640 [Desulfobacterales bacterium]|nr:MAG: hypothetical protein DRI57_06920 [Deltaproteobacteria bacterium]HHC24106.1 hypothetical protein [Desulfobacterales bacterium]